jgi:hypothetical protein
MRWLSPPLDDLPMPSNDQPAPMQKLPLFPLPPVSRLDVGFAAAAGVVGGASALGRRMVALGKPVAELMVLSPPLVPRRYQPRRVVELLALRGSQEREELGHELADVLDRVVPKVVDELLRRMDLDAVVARLDLAKLADEVIASVDLPELIRESTEAVQSQAVREVRMRSISGDEAVGRAMERLRPRRRRVPTHVER